ncbi:MAG: DUF2779 domain-containing protein [Nanoarchaeota archaeon]|nr:DUF2779 domain-containing protein [Nanoarchaeota archaeon]
MALLTKSKYLVGLQCPRYLWALIYDKEKIPNPDVSVQFKFDEGTKVGELATKLFPDGINVPFEDFNNNLKKSKELLKKKKPLFEAGFRVGNCFSRADILVPVGDKWDIIEVKSGTKVKDINIHDMAFQKYCYESEGLKIRNCFLMHLNNEYIKKGEIDIEKLFVKDNITPEVEESMKNTKEKINYILEVINKDKYPEAVIGPQCKNPYECPLTECWDFLPENHVFHLYRGGKKSLQLFEDGIYAIGDIPKDFKLSDKQGIQKDCEVKGEIHVHKEKIKHFLKTLLYPLYYLDFETFSTAIPMFDGLKPYSPVCFQFSLHVVEKEGDKPKHYEFLYSGNNDPREDFVLALKEVLGDKGSIIVYNQSFEISRLKELGEQFPEHKNWVENTIGRIVDLLIPFRNFSYYNPIQKGSASIKKILPALTGKDYSEMEIGDGATASVKFYNMAYKNGKDVRTALLKYCGLDTLAEIMIVNSLHNLVRE